MCQILLENCHFTLQLIYFLNKSHCFCLSHRWARVRFLRIAILNESSWQGSLCVFENSARLGLKFCRSYVVLKPLEHGVL